MSITQYNTEQVVNNITINSAHLTIHTRIHMLLCNKVLYNNIHTLSRTTHDLKL